MLFFGLKYSYFKFAYYCIVSPFKPRPDAKSGLLNSLVLSTLFKHYGKKNHTRCLVTRNSHSLRASIFIVLRPAAHWRHLAADLTLIGMRQGTFQVHIMQLDHIGFAKSPFYFWPILCFSVFPAQFWIFSKLLMQFEWRPLRLLSELL